jgi:serine/threonine protein kinase
LAKRIDKTGLDGIALEAKVILGWLIQALSGLKFLQNHNLKIIHRDIKPELECKYYLDLE